MNRGSPGDPTPTGWYRIRLQARLDPRWSEWLDGMEITDDNDGTTVLAGPVVDQSALHGLLARLRDLGLPLISVARIEPTKTRHHPPQHPTGD